MSELQDEGKGKLKNPFTFVRGEAYLQLKRDPQPWLVHKLVPSGGVMAIGGAPKTGKSFTALGIAVAVANPKIDKFWDQQVVKHGPVLYLQVDTPREEWAGRIERIKALGIDDVYWTDANLVPYPLTITDPGIKFHLHEKIKELKPVMVVVDTLREVHNEDENDATAMKQVIQGLVEVTKGTGTTLLLVAHTRKEAAKKKGEEYHDDPIGDLRGSNYIAGRCDVVSKQTADRRFVCVGRSIGGKTFHLEQDPTTMLWRLRDRSLEIESAVKYVMTAPEMIVKGNEQKTYENRLNMLKAMTGLEDDRCKELIAQWQG